MEEKEKTDEEKIDEKGSEDRIINEANNLDVHSPKIIPMPEFGTTLIDIKNTAHEKMKPIIDMQNAVHEKMKPIIDMQNAIHEKMKPIIDMQNAVHEKVKPIIDIKNEAHEKMQPILEAQEKVNKLIQPLIDMLNRIDWDLIRESVRERIKEIEGILIEQENNFWCLDMDSMLAIMEGKITQDDLTEYVDANLESYITKIIQDPMYELHATLIEETYRAYKAGLYKLCTMPLFAAFEHIFTLWYMGKINTDGVTVNYRPDVKRLYYKIKPEKYKEDNDVEQEGLNTIFSLSVLRMYKNIFIKIPDELCQELNRNSIAHGYHNYDSLTKVEVLKLFQLLKSALILKSFDSNKVAES
ncbi:hypothetical protein [Bacillus thuringiensis]|uniref:hypothetical protein n=1 Tax=Bacillus thuringiensis TaxID=1428 RepID=UPI001F4F342D|nr:hypothetical protein [Bacillus thuringiensis]